MQLEKCPILLMDKRIPYTLQQQIHDNRVHFIITDEWCFYSYSLDQLREIASGRPPSTYADFLREDLFGLNGDLTLIFRNHVFYLKFPPEGLAQSVLRDQVRDLLRMLHNTRTPAVFAGKLEARIESGICNDDAHLTTHGERKILVKQLTANMHGNGTHITKRACGFLLAVRDFQIGFAVGRKLPQSALDRAAMNPLKETQLLGIITAFLFTARR